MNCIYVFLLFFASGLWAQTCKNQYILINSSSAFTSFKVNEDNVTADQAVKCLSKSKKTRFIIKDSKTLGPNDFLKKGQILKVPNTQLKGEYRSALELTPFVFVLSRSISQKSLIIANRSHDLALRLGTNLQWKDFKSRVFYESGKSFSRIDADLGKKIFKNFYLGGRFVFISSEFIGPLGDKAKFATGKILAQLGWFEKIRGDIQLNLRVASAFSTDFLADLIVSKDFTVFSKWIVSPTIGLDYSQLVGDKSRFHTTGILVGGSFKKDI